MSTHPYGGHRWPQRRLTSDGRGANLVEYIMVVGVVALVALFGFRIFGTSIAAKQRKQADCVVALDPGCVQAAASSSAAGSAGPVSMLPQGEVSPRFDTTTSYRGLEDVNLAGVRYVRMGGTPFAQCAGDATDCDPNDISQGQIGDCYFMSSLAETALRHPEVVRNAIKENGDGTYTVTLYEKAPWYKFWKSYEPVEITVGPDFPSKDGVHPYFASMGDNAAGGGPELWPALIEKAYAKENRGYDKIGNGGFGSEAMAALTGHPSRRSSSGWFGWQPGFEEIADAWDRGEMITAGSKREGDGPLFKQNVLVRGHEYYVTNVDRTNRTITVRNPWGWSSRGSPTTLSFEDYKTHFGYICTNPGPDKPR